MENHKNLVDQCVQGEGTVQVNVQIKADEHGNKKINIVDVLKPAEEYVEIKPRKFWEFNTVLLNNLYWKSRAFVLILLK